MSQPLLAQPDLICKDDVKLALDIARRLSAGLTVMPGDIVFLAKIFICLINWLKQLIGDRTYSQIPKVVQDNL